MSPFLAFFVAYFTFEYVSSAVPKWPATYQMNSSTFVMTCNDTGYYNDDALQKLAKFGIVDIDWSNARDLWENASPMNCEESLLSQVTAIKKINPSTKTWVYRNLVKALPWFTDVREKILDPAYSGWFLKFKPNGGPYNVPVCTNTTINGKTSNKCSMLYHDQMHRVPHYPSDCKAECDCGENLPCGEYLWDHRNASLRTWLTDTFILSSVNNEGLLNANIDGFYIDDYWSDKPHNPPSNKTCDFYNSFGGPSEIDYKCAQDMGLDANDVKDLYDGWTNSMAMADNAIIEHNGFACHMFQRVNTPSKSSCIGYYRSNAKTLNSTTTAYLYDYTQTSDMTQTEFENDLALFLLTRGPYAWLGYWWNGCHSTWAYQWNDMLDQNYGEPTEPFQEIQSGVFERKWSKGTVQFDCNAYKASFDFIE